MAVHEIVPERGIVVDAGSRVDPAKKTARRGCLCANHLPVHGAIVRSACDVR